jgi:hypothetical protein
MNYLVVLFKNKEKRKIINKFKTKKKALDFYNKLVSESNDVVFNKSTENGFECFFELALLEKKEMNQDKVYIKDELGRTILVKTDSEDYNILKISNYNIEEDFVDYSTKQKITSLGLEKKYLSKSGIKLVSKLNNKIVVQNDEKINLFTFKNSDDADRFITSFEKYYTTKKKDCIFVKDYSFPQRKYMYELLTNYGFPKSYLQRYSTTHPVKK